MVGGSGTHRRASPTGAGHSKIRRVNPPQSESAATRHSVDPALTGAVFCLAASLGYTVANGLMRALVVDTFEPLIIGVKEAVTVLTVGPWLLWYWFRGRPLWPSARMVGRLALIGLATQVLGNLNLLYAYGRLGMAVSMPVMMGVNLSCSALFGRIFLGELVTRRTVLALALLVAAIGFLSAGAGDGAALPQPAGTQAGAGSSFWGVTLGVLAAVCAGVAFATMATGVRASVTTAASTPATVFIITAMGVVTMGPISLFHLGVEKLVAVPAANLGLMLVAGVLNLLSFLAITTGLRLTTVARANLLNSSQVALSAVVGIVWFHEPPTSWMIVGIVLTIVGMTLIEPGNAPMRPVAVKSSREVLSFAKSDREGNC